MRLPRPVLVSLRRHLHQLANAIETRERLADLGADRRHLDHGGGHETREEDVGEEISDRHVPSGDRAPADEDDEDDKDEDDDADNHEVEFDPDLQD